MIHRGPDEEGMFCDGAVGLGIRRLSIIDIEGGSQPIFNEDRTVCAVCNGEIYNFRELRSDLQKRGHSFSSKSDTEVLVHLYEEYGSDLVTHLNGMFALAVWDRTCQRLVLARDRLGKKPLYYAKLKDGVVFGSELKSVLACSKVPRELDRAAVYHYFTLGYIPAPWSIYKDVRQLPPAGRITVEGDRLEVDRYWKLDLQVNRSLCEDDVRSSLRELLTDSVKRRMISDVPLGGFLSGGLDSSIVVALMAQNSSSTIKTFHIDFHEPDYSERRYARLVARRYGTEHHELVVEPSAVGILDDLVECFDEPFGDSSAVPTYYVSKLTREHITVALAGDGGDESFGGYENYLHALSRQSLPDSLRAALGFVGNAIHRCLPRTAPGRRYFRSLGLSDYQHHAPNTQEFETRELLSREFLEPITPISTFDALRASFEDADAEDPLAPFSAFDLHHYLPNDILTKVDRTSMAHSLEVRAPLLDYRVVELAAQLPTAFKVRKGVSKYILKSTFAHDLPAEVLEQRKSGFSIPLEHWLRNELKPVLQDAIHDRQIAETGFFQVPEIHMLAREHLSGARDRSEQLWRYIIFTRWWHRNHSLLAAA